MRSWSGWSSVPTRKRIRLIQAVAGRGSETPLYRPFLVDLAAGRKRSSPKATTAGATTLRPTITAQAAIQAN